MAGEHQHSGASERGVLFWYTRVCTAQPERCERGGGWFGGARTYALRESTRRDDRRAHHLLSQRSPLRITVNLGTTRGELLSLSPPLPLPQFALAVAPICVRYPLVG